MTPEELLRDLRDIHLPEVAGGGGFEIAFEPFLFLIAALLLLAGLAWRRARLWRRQAQARLRRIDGAAGPREQWPQLLALARRVGRLSQAAPPPDCAYLPPERVGSEEVAVLRRYLRDCLRT